MDFLNEDLYDLPSQSQFYKDNYESFSSSCTRKFFVLHTLMNLMFVKNVINSNNAKDIREIKDEQFKNIKFEDSSEYLGKKIASKLQAIQSELGKGEEITAKHMFRLLITTFKEDLIETIFCYCCDAVLRICLSIIIIFIFNSVQSQNYQLCYVLIAILCIVWYFDQLIKQIGFTKANVLSSKIKSALAMLLYTKISSLSSYVIKSSKLGRITNLLASDLGVFELKLGTFLTCFAFPIVCIGCTVLLIIRLGWPGVLGVIIVVLTFPLSNLISKRNGQYITQINHYKDKRVQITTQVIEGIKYIKLYGWQIAFRRIIQSLREQEIIKLKKLSFGKSVERAIPNFIGFASGLVMFVVADYFATQLNMAQIFTGLEIISAYKFAIFMFSLGLGFYYQVTVVFERFASIINIKNICMIQIDPISKEPVKEYTLKESSTEQKLEITRNQFYQSFNNYTIQNIPASSLNKHKQMKNLQKGEIIMENFCGYWKETFEVESLKNINLFFKKGVFYGITGKVGSGKSGLLGVILRQIPYYSGTININGRVSYVQQEPIIFSATIRNNILYGRDFNQDLYNHVVQISCLITDFQILEDGDQTMVGQKGITLSGGQKARLALARSLYAESDIFIFDDPISAVDSKVARQIHEKCLKKLSHTKTVILVTHQISFLYDCDEIIIMDQGSVIAKGTPEQLKKQLIEMSSLFKKDQQSEQENAIINKLQEQQREQLVQHIASIKQSMVAQSQKKPKISNKFYEKQVFVTVKTYLKYIFFNPQNYIIFPICLICFLISEGILTAYLRFLAMHDMVASNTQNPFGSDFSLYWGILGMLMGLQFIVLTVKYYLLNLTILNSNQKIHQQMINGIVRCPSSFFDSTPSGVLINKFSNDLGILDTSLSHTLIDTFEGPASILVALINVCQIEVYFVAPLVIIAIIAISFFNYAKPVIMQCKLKDLKNKSPIFNFYSETISGLVQIKTYNRRKSLIQEFSVIINNSSRAAISFDLVSRGFGFYQTMLTLCLLFAGLEIGIIQLNPANAGLFGVTLIFLVNFCQFFQWLLRQIITAQSLLISSERAFQVINLKPEKQLRKDYDRQIGLNVEVEAAQKDSDIHLMWPQSPSIEFKDLSARYKPELPYVLKDLNFTVEKYSKIGIVGRTGAGKSSIIQAIFRIIQPELGSQFKIDNFNALDMGLHSLRQHISVIPQTPFIFKGSVKQNIDPFETSDETQIWKVLQESGLIDHVRSLPNQLLTDISNTSESFSVGQKQLLCLARALLRRNKILVLDEATSNVDMTTDNFIQQIIKQKFKNTTVITIAHRLNTIADYDKIIVMQKGRIIQQGSPYELILRKGTFYEMIGHTGKNAELIINKSKNSYEKNRKNKMNEK